MEEEICFNEFEKCTTKGCICVGAHSISECHTAEDLDSYYEQLSADAE